MEKKFTVLKEYRKKSGYTQTALAELIGVTHQTINNWEHGIAKPSDESIAKLANVFNVSPEKFYDQMVIELADSKLQTKQYSKVRFYESIEHYVDKSAKCLITVNYSDADSLIAVRVNDDSMASYHLPKNSIAIIRTKGLVISGILAMISINHQTPRIAKVMTDGEYITLSFGSRKFPDEKYDLYRTSVEVIGKVIGYMGDI